MSYLFLSCTELKMNIFIRDEREEDIKEIEEVIAKHPTVLEVAAIGVPDEKSGEVPKLFIVKKDPANEIKAK